MSGSSDALVPKPRPGRAARATRAIDAAANSKEYLAFDLATERYALPLGCVREIMRVPQVTEVPRGPDDVLGVISARGAVTTLIDLRRRLHLPEAPQSHRSRVLLVDLGEEIVGLLVDAVLQVHRLAQDEIEFATVMGGSAPTHLSGIGRPNAHAVDKDADKSGDKDAGERTASSGELLLLIDPDALLGERGPAR
jgi:purine-binding chemotaxis protein CheW